MFKWQDEAVFKMAQVLIVFLIRPLKWHWLIKLLHNCNPQGSAVNPSGFQVTLLFGSVSKKINESLKFQGIS
jgi:hypothetical protein